MPARDKNMYVMRFKTKYLFRKVKHLAREFKTRTKPIKYERGSRRARIAEVCSMYCKKLYGYAGDISRDIHVIATESDIMR